MSPGELQATSRHSLTSPATPPDRPATPRIPYRSRPRHVRSGRYGFSGVTGLFTRESESSSAVLRAPGRNPGISRRTPVALSRNRESPARSRIARKPLQITRNEETPIALALGVLRQGPGRAKCASERLAPRTGRFTNHSLFQRGAKTASSTAAQGVDSNPRDGRPRRANHSPDPNGEPHACLLVTLG
jgi:hypothetical protein